MQDITLVCKDCGNEFVWTAGEQEFYQQKGLVNQPVRCPECRKKRKAEREARESQNAQIIGEFQQPFMWLFFYLYTKNFLLHKIIQGQE